MKKTYAEKKLENISKQDTFISRSQKMLDALRAQLKSIDAISAVVIFGSYARGDFSEKHSDIDLLVFLDKQDPDASLEESIKRAVLEKSTVYGLPIHLLFQYRRITEEDRGLVQTIADEGKPLFAKETLIIGKNILGLKSHNVVRFDYSSANQVAKNKLQRLLYGYRTKGKQYKGLVDEENVITAGRGAIIIPEELREKVLHLAQTMGIKAKVAGKYYR
ncbi:nucleotidyltransferase domain-containing protein [Candidatus Woesearchaeota archaeon]|nr:nucleotidyltransferase domain-containing protein [Candidatus Woesearchaeota archaeon]